MPYSDAFQTGLNKKKKHEMQLCVYVCVCMFVVMWICVLSMKIN